MIIKRIEYTIFKYSKNEKISLICYGNCPIFGQIYIYYNNDTKLYEGYYEVVHFEDDNILGGTCIRQYNFKFKNQLNNLEEYECKTLEECILMIEKIREYIILSYLEYG